MFLLQLAFAYCLQKYGAINQNQSWKKNMAAWCIGTGLTIGLAVTPVDAADLALGSEVFGNSCATCHSGGNNVIESQKTLRKEALETYLDGGFSVESIIYQVENGKGAMPAWEGVLSPEEIQSVAAYVYDQATNSKW